VLIRVVNGRIVHAKIAKGNDPMRRTSSPASPGRQRRKAQNPTKAEKKAIYKRDNHTCQRCSRYMGEPHRRHERRCDHIIPVTKGGTKKPTNLQTLCVECNDWKGDSLTR
jgi:5-methylcytosine-specific restriction endonuclease McrA